MRILRHTATAAVLSVTLFAAAQGFAGTTLQPAGNSGSQPANGQTQNSGQNLTPARPAAPYGRNPLTGDQLSKEYRNLSSATRAALANQLKSKGMDGLTKMSEGDARTTFASLPPEVKARIQAKWDAMSDEQRIALKKMGPAAVEELVASQMREMMKQSVSPVTKPVAQVVEKVSSAADKAKSIMQKGRDYVLGLIAKMKGGSTPPEGPGGN